MKTQDLIAVIVLAVIVSALGLMAANSFTTPPSENFTTSEEPQPVPSGFSEEGIEYLTDGAVSDFTVNVNGVEAPKNSNPFGN